MKHALRVDVLASMLVTVVAGPFVSAVFGQQLDADKIRELAARVPTKERFIFGRQLLNGAVRDLNPDKGSDLEILNQIADTWTNWARQSDKEGSQLSDWVTFAQTANSAAMKRYDVPLIIDDENFPRLTGLALPIDLDGVRQLEAAYSKWSRDRDEASRRILVLLLVRVPGERALPSAREDFARRVDALNSSSAPRRWNELMYHGGDFKWSRTVFADAGQKYQVDRGVQRVLLASDWGNTGDRAQASSLGRDYVKLQAINQPGLWEKFIEVLSQVAAQKRLQTIVTFATRNSQRPTKDATIAYRLANSAKPERTIQTKVTINSGDYEVWSERDDKPTSAKMLNHIFSDAMQVEILERDDATP